MSHVALARKWRPQRFEDVIGQRGVVDTLKNAIGTGRLAQSFIFAGPRGVGKTTTARILARALNCVKGPTATPCGKCDACTEIAEGRDIDVLEIDGATYTGIDKVREVIVEPLAIAPMRDRFKIFIIDEVHRLSKQAFDALLKSIEEPPPYVKFMMATTDLHSVPATIQSRSQVFELKTLPFNAIRDQLKQITSREKVKVDDAALSLVARSAEGSMRDALSALDQILAFTTDTVTAADVSTVLGVIGRDSQFDIADIVAREDAAAAFTAANHVVDAGFDLRVVCRELARLMRDLLVLKIDPDRISDPEIASDTERERLQTLAEQFSREDLMRSFNLLSRAEYDIRRSSQPRHQFEMSLLQWIHLRKLTPLSDLLSGSTGSAGSAGSAGLSRQSREPGERSATADSSGSGKSAQFAKPAGVPPSVARPAFGGANRTVSPSTESIKPEPPKPEPPKSVAAAATDAGAKSVLLAAIREGNKALYSMVVAQAQKVEIEGDSLVLTFAPAHKALKAQLEGKRNWIEHVAKASTGRAMKLVTRDGEAAPPPPPPNAADAARRADMTARAKAAPTVQAVLDVFGGEIETVEEEK